MNELFKVGATILFTKGWEFASSYLSESVVDKGVALYRWHKLFDAVADFVKAHPLATICFTANVAFAAFAMHTRMIYTKLLREHQTLLQTVDHEEQIINRSTIAMRLEFSRLMLISNKASGEGNNNSMTTISENSESPTREAATSTSLDRRIAASDKNVERAREDVREALRFTAFSVGASIIALTFETYIHSPYANQPKPVEPKIEMQVEETVTASGDKTRKETPIQILPPPPPPPPIKSELQRSNDILVINDLDGEAQVSIYNNWDVIYAKAAESFKMKKDAEKLIGGNWASSFTNGAQVCYTKDTNTKQKCQTINLGGQVKLSEI